MKGVWTRKGFEKFDLRKEVNKGRHQVLKSILKLSLVADGTEVVLTEDNTPIARLVPISKRVAGLHTGAIWISEDFDAPLPDEFWTENA